MTIPSEMLPDPNDPAYIAFAAHEDGIIVQAKTTFAADALANGSDVTDERVKVALHMVAHSVEHFTGMLMEALLPFALTDAELSKALHQPVVALVRLGVMLHGIGTAEALPADPFADDDPERFGSWNDPDA